MATHIKYDKTTRIFLCHFLIFEFIIRHNVQKDRNIFYLIFFLNDIIGIEDVASLKWTHGIII